MNLYLLQQYQFIQRLYKNEGYLDVLLNIDDFFDILHIYAFPNWMEAEVVDVDFLKYFTHITLKAPRSDDKSKDRCPDPKAGVILTKYDCKVEYTKSNEVMPKEVESMDDAIYDKRRDKYRPKMERKDIWLVDILIPNKHIINNNVYDLEAIQAKLDEEDDANDELESVVANNEDMAGEQI